MMKKSTTTATTTSAVAAAVSTTTTTTTAIPHPTTTTTTTTTTRSTSPDDRIITNRSSELEAMFQDDDEDDDYISESLASFVANAKQMLLQSHIDFLGDDTNNNNPPPSSVAPTAAAAATTTPVVPKPNRHVSDDDYEDYDDDDDDDRSDVMMMPVVNDDVLFLGDSGMETTTTTRPEPPPPLIPESKDDDDNNDGNIYDDDEVVFYAPSDEVDHHHPSAIPSSSSLLLWNHHPVLPTQSQQQQQQQQQHEDYQEEPPPPLEQPVTTTIIKNHHMMNDNILPMDVDHDKKKKEEQDDLAHGGISNQMFWSFDDSSPPQQQNQVTPALVEVVVKEEELPPPPPVAANLSPPGNDDDDANPAKRSWDVAVAVTTATTTQVLPPNTRNRETGLDDDHLDDDVACHHDDVDAAAVLPQKKDDTICFPSNAKEKIIPADKINSFEQPMPEKEEEPYGLTEIIITEQQQPLDHAPAYDASHGASPLITSPGIDQANGGNNGIFRFPEEEDDNRIVPNIIENTTKTPLTIDTTTTTTIMEITEPKEMAEKSVNDLAWPDVMTPAAAMQTMENGHHDKIPTRHDDDYFFTPPMTTKMMMNTMMIPTTHQQPPQDDKDEVEKEENEEKEIRSNFYMLSSPNDDDDKGELLLSSESMIMDPTTTITTTNNNNKMVVETTTSQMKKDTAFVFPDQPQEIVHEIMPIAITEKYDATDPLLLTSSMKDGEIVVEETIDPYIMEESINMNLQREENEAVIAEETMDTPMDRNNIVSVKPITQHTTCSPEIADVEQDVVVVDIKANHAMADPHPPDSHRNTTSLVSPELSTAAAAAATTTTVSLPSGNKSGWFGVWKPITSNHNEPIILSPSLPQPSSPSMNNTYQVATTMTTDHNVDILPSSSVGGMLRWMVGDITGSNKKLSTATNQSSMSDALAVHNQYPSIDIMSTPPPVSEDGKPVMQDDSKKVASMTSASKKTMESPKKSSIATKINTTATGSNSKTMLPKPGNPVSASPVQDIIHSTELILQTAPSQTSMFSPAGTESMSHAPSQSKKGGGSPAIQLGAMATRKSLASFRASVTGRLARIEGIRTASEPKPKKTMARFTPASAERLTKRKCDPDTPTISAVQILELKMRTAGISKISPEAIVQETMRRTDHIRPIGIRPDINITTKKDHHVETEVETEKHMGIFRKRTTDRPAGHDHHSHDKHDAQLSIESSYHKFATECPHSPGIVSPRSVSPLSMSSAVASMPQKPKSTRARKNFVFLESSVDATQRSRPVKCRQTTIDRLSKPKHTVQPVKKTLTTTTTTMMNNDVRSARTLGTDKKGIAKSTTQEAPTIKTKATNGSHHVTRKMELLSKRLPVKKMEDATGPSSRIVKGTNPPLLLGDNKEIIKRVKNSENECAQSSSTSISRRQLTIPVSPKFATNARFATKKQLLINNKSTNSNNKLSVEQRQRSPHFGLRVGARVAAAETTTSSSKKPLTKQPTKKDIGTNRMTPASDLNSNSKVEIPKSFQDDKRKVPMKSPVMIITKSLSNEKRSTIQALAVGQKSSPPKMLGNNIGQPFNF